MGDFYKGLSDGMPKDEALRQAKLNYLGDAPAMKHPFFWAGLVMVGDNAPLRKRNWWVWGGGAALIVGMGGLALWKRKRHEALHRTI